MVVLSCKNIAKSYGIDVIFKNITFSINEGENIGFVGQNGAGKSTLFKILSKQLEADKGDIFIDKNKKIGYLSQHLSLNSDNNIYEEMLSVFQELLDIEEKLSNLEIEMNKPYDHENEAYHNKIIKSYTSLTDLYNHRGGYTYKAEIGKVLKGLGFTEDHYEKCINILSGGQKTRVALCKLLLSNPDVLLLDEPTNHLDLDAIEWLEEYLSSYKGTIVVISHDRFFLDSVTNQTYELINGQMELYNGNYSKFVELRKKRDEEKEKAFVLQQSEIKRQEEIIDRFRSFNREKSIRAAESRQKALDKIERIDAPSKNHKIHKINFDVDVKSGNDVLFAENLRKAYGDKLLFENVEFEIKSGDKTALIGENGRGKTTLFNIIMNKLTADEGFVSLGKNVEIGYYDQEQSNLDPEKSILEEVWDSFPHMATKDVRNALAAFLFRGDDVFKKISTLSGGEKCRINLLKLMLSKSNFLLLDEPTNHLDVMSREAVEDALMSYDGTVLVISHDRYFLNKVVHKIHELCQDGMKSYLGNYSYFVEKKKNPNRFQDEEQYEGKTKTQIKNEKKKSKEEKKLEKQKELETKNLEAEILATETKIEELQNLLCLEEVYSNPLKSEEITKEIKVNESSLERLYEKWEEII
jgi:ATP-binding cassette subfamily F protein 3